MTDFKSITEFYLKFDHPIDQNMTKILNRIYADTIPNHARLYADLDNQTTVSDDADLLLTLRNIVTEEMIAPYAHHSPEAISIFPFINRASFYIEYFDNRSPQRRLTRTSLTALLQQAREQNRPTVTIIMGCGHIYADPKLYINYFDWTKLSLDQPADPPAPAPAPSAPSSAADIAVAVAKAFPMAAIVKAVADNVGPSIATAVQSATLSGSGTGPSSSGKSSNPGTSPTASALWTFNVNGLPTDVKDRYNNNLHRKLITGKSIITNYSSGHMYHEDGT